MGKKFFESWETWEKLVFVLACAIVVTVFLGCGKLAYTHWRLRKYAAVEKEKKDQAMHRQMSQQRKLRGSCSDTVPFGVRALESGIEIDGVWISRGNTPEVTSRENSAASSEWDNALQASNGLDVEKQELPQSYFPSTSNSSAASDRLNCVSLDRPIVYNSLPSSDKSQDRSPDAQIARPARSRHPPLSYIRYEGNPYILRRQSPATTTLQGSEAIHNASKPIRSREGGSSAESSFSSNRSSNGCTDVEPISAFVPDLLAAQQNRRTIRGQFSVNLELLNSHRVSQAAETGQLTPRGQRPEKAHSVDFATPSAQSSPSLERSEYFGVQYKAVRPLLDTAGPTKQICSPKIDSLPLAIRRTSMPDVTPFAQFCKMAPLSSPPESSRSNSMDSTETVTPKSGDHNEHNSEASSPIIPASEGATELKLPPPSRGSFEKQTSQVVRGLGTGFEILRHGSFDLPIPKDQTVEKQVKLPPLSLQNSSRMRSSVMGSDRKLQKKRQPSMDSLANSNTSRRSRISLYGSCATQI